MLKGERLSFDEESKRALRRRRADERRSALPAGARSPRASGSRASGPLVERYDAWRRAFVIPREKLDPVFKAAIAACRERTLKHVTLPPERDIHGRVRHQQVVERLQLVSGQLPQPDPGQHRSADLHRSRHRPGVPRRISRPSRLQRAARDSISSRIAAGSSSPSIRCSRRSRSSPKARRTSASRSRSPGTSGSSSSGRRCFRSPASIRRERRSTTTSRRSWMSCRTRATKRRDGISTAGSIATRPRRGSSATR